MVRRHQDHVVSTEFQSRQPAIEDQTRTNDVPVQTEQLEAACPEMQSEPATDDAQHSDAEQEEKKNTDCTETTIVPRRSGRVHKPVDRYGL